MANITRIKAGGSRRPSAPEEIAEAEVVERTKKSKQQAQAAVKSKSAPQPPKSAKPAAESKSAGSASKTAKPPKKPAKPDYSRLTKREKKAARRAYRLAKKEAKQARRAAKKARRRPLPKWLLALTAPFRAVGRYLRDSWAELRQVRWPSRKATWKLTIAVIVYCAIFIIIITVLDLIFAELSGWLLG